MMQDSDNINPVALLFLVCMGFAMWTSRKQVAARTLLAVAAFLPLGQQVVLFGLHFTFLRILIFVGVCRLLVRGEARSIQWQTADKLFLPWVLTGLICGMLRDPKAEILGLAYNSLGVYYLFRSFIQEPEEAIGHLRFLAFAVTLIACEMVFETVTHRDLFAVFGGVPDILSERDGRFRCQGPFRHSILAGTFAATLFPLFIGLWYQGRRHRKAAIFGVLSCVFCTYATASSGPLLSLLTTIIGLMLWPLRNRMHLIRRGIVATVIGLALVMKAPVWYLIAKVSDVIGGTGWHRSYLIDQAINHFDEWWLIGSSHTAHWAPGGQVLLVDPNNMDITNHYIAQGLQGGVLRLGLFLAIIVYCYKFVGRASRDVTQAPDKAKLWWAMGASLTGHCVAFVSVSYFDQIEVFWFWLWAVITALPARERKGATVDKKPADEQSAAFPPVPGEVMARCCDGV